MSSQNKTQAQSIRGKKIFPMQISVTLIPTYIRMEREKKPRILHIFTEDSYFKWERHCIKFELDISTGVGGVLRGSQIGRLQKNEIFLDYGLLNSS